MPIFSTRIRTDHASKYLQQLCKHFAHKVMVEFSPGEGRVAFPPGRCLMSAGDDVLQFYCDAKEDRGVPAIKAILDEHLVKFAWREELEYEWVDGAPTEIASELVREDFLAAQNPQADAGQAR